MAIDIETIGIAVDSSGLTKGTRELDKFSQSADKASRGADGVGSSSKASSSSLTGLATVARGAAIGVAAVGASVLALGATLLKTYLEVDKLNKILQFSTGSAANAAKELDYLKQVTNQLGLEFNSTALSYAKFAAAAKGTNLEGQKTRDIFESIAKASSVLGLSADDTAGALKAIEQMISKGTVSAEELRGQLGERLPGVFQIAARAIGVTTQELGKMLEQGSQVSDVFLPKLADELNKTFGDGATSAAGSAQAQLNRLSNEWLDFKKNIAQSGVMTIVLNVAEGTNNALKWFNHFVFNKGELADLNKVNSDRNNLASLEGKVNSRKPESSLFETGRMKQSRLNTFNASQAKDKAEIRRLRLSLGIDNGSSVMPATGDTTQSLLAPNFGVTKKDGTGGYDASTNTQKTSKNQSSRAAQKDSTLESIKLLQQENSLIAQGVPIEDARTIARLRASGASDKQVVSYVNLTNAQKLLIDNLTAEEAFYTGLEKSLDAQQETRDAQIESITKSAIALELENITYGKLPSAITDVGIATLEKAKADAISIGLIGDNIIAIDQEIAALKRLQAAQSGKERLGADKKSSDERVKLDKEANDKILKQHEELSKDINKSLTDALLRGFESGKGFAKNFRDTLVNMFKTLVLRPAIEAILKPLTDGIAGVAGGGIGNLLGGGTSAGGSIFGSASNLLSVGKSIYSGFSSSLSSNIGGLVANISPKLGSAIAGKMLGSSAGLGPTVAGSVSGIGSIAGSVGSLGSAISTALPYIGLALGAFTLFKGLIGKRKKTQGDQSNGSYQNGVFSTSRTFSPEGGGSFGAGSALEQLNKTFSESLGGFLGEMGLNQSINTSSNFKSKKGKSQGAFSGSIDGVGFGGGWKNVKDFEEFAKSSFSGVFVEAIKASKLSDGIKGLFNGLTERSQIDNMINASITLQGAQKELADKFGLTVDMAGKVASASGRAGDALGEFVKALSTVAMSGSTIGAQLVKSKGKLFGDFNNVFGDLISEAVLSTVSRQVEMPASRAEGNGSSWSTPLEFLSRNSPVKQFQTVTEQVTTFITRIASRNLQLPKTIADYDDLLKNIDKTALSGQKMFADVFALRDQFVAKINAENGLKGNLRSGLAGIVPEAEKQSMLNEDLATLFGELKMAVPATIQELINAGKGALEQLNLGTATEATYNLAAAFPSLVSAFKETKDGIESLVNSLRDESGFKTLYDYNFYKGIAGNYGNDFANRLNDGAEVTYGASNNTSVSMANNVVPINNTTISTSDPNMLNAVAALTQTINALKAELVAIKASSAETSRILTNVTEGGRAMQTEVYA